MVRKVSWITKYLTPCTQHGGVSTYFQLMINGTINRLPVRLFWIQWNLLTYLVREVGKNLTAGQWLESTSNMFRLVDWYMPLVLSNQQIGSQYLVIRNAQQSVISNASFLSILAIICLQVTYKNSHMKCRGEREGLTNNHSHNIYQQTDCRPNCLDLTHAAARSTVLYPKAMAMDLWW